MQEINNVVLACGHSLHADCFSKWVLISQNAQCPECRKKACPTPKCKRPALPMKYTCTLDVHACESNMNFLDSVWGSSIGKILGASWTPWRQILVHHAALVEIAYEVPEEIPYADGVGDIEEFIDRFRGIICDITKDSKSGQAETKWLMSVLCQTEEDAAGISMGARLVLLVQGMADYVATEPADAESARGMVMNSPYSHICSGRARELHNKGWL